ncbi:MAG: integron integrase [Elusimicrobia bacterium]|nr:integron integrase [Elusimicrobiota bacterium]
MEDPSRKAQVPARPPRLLEKFRDAIRLRHYSFRTEQAYEHWIKRFIRFHDMRHPREMGPPEVERFLSHLATDRNLSASSQNQALNALAFLYHEVLRVELGDLGEIARAKRPAKLPVVLTREEVGRLLSAMSGTYRLMAELLYGTGMRLGECLELRVKDVDFGAGHVMVRGGKGMKDRVTMLPKRLEEPLKRHLAYVQTLHESDLRRGGGMVWLPFAFKEKCPSAEKAWGWQFVFPGPSLWQDPRDGLWKRHHCHESPLQKAVGRASRQAGLDKPVGPHTLRHCFATHLIEAGYDIRTAQELLGHRDVSTTMIYTHVLSKPGAEVRSPLDSMRDLQG